MKKIILFLFLFISATVFASGAKDLKVYGNVSNGAAYLSTGKFTIITFDDDVVNWESNTNIMILAGVHKIVFSAKDESIDVGGVISDIVFSIITKIEIYSDNTKYHTINGSTKHKFEKGHVYEMELKSEGFFDKKYYYSIKDLGKAE